MVGRPLGGSRNDCKAWEESGAKAAAGNTVTIADGGYPGTGLVIPHRRKRGQTELPDWKEEHNKSHKQVRARVEHAFARMKTGKILRDCRLKGDGVHHAMLGIARMHNLALAKSRLHVNVPNVIANKHLRDYGWVDQPISWCQCRATRRIAPTPGALTAIGEHREEQDVVASG